MKSLNYFFIFGFLVLVYILYRLFRSKTSLIVSSSSGESSIPVAAFSSASSPSSTGVRRLWELTCDEYNKFTGKKFNAGVLTVVMNNPGAIFYFGDDWLGLDKTRSEYGKISAFSSVSYGVRAHVKTLLNYYRLHGLDTVRSIITRYAPPGVHNNHTDNYIKFVSDFLGVSSDQVLLMTDKEFLARFAYAQHIVEAGFSWVSFDLYLSKAKEL
jgi:hypothetical protein